jgi:hypothetical protein
MNNEKEKRILYFLPCGKADKQLNIARLELFKNDNIKNKEKKFADYQYLFYLSMFKNLNI